MITDRTPRKAALRAEFSASDRLNSLALPADNRLTLLAQDIHRAMLSAQRTAVREASAEFLLAASEFYRVSRPEVRALAVRPLWVREGGWATELFGDYSLGTALIRIWTRTPVRKQVTSFGTLLSTLCHEFCHHLDCQRFGFRHSPHTRGFYERAAALYHHAHGTPRKALFWIAMPSGRWRIDWRRMNAAFSSKRF